MIEKGEVHPFVGGMGLGEADAGCGGGITKTPGSGFKQASDDPNSRLDCIRESRGWAQTRVRLKLKAPSRGLSDTIPPVDASASPTPNPPTHCGSPLLNQLLPNQG